MKTSQDVDQPNALAITLNPLESPPQVLKDFFKAWRPHLGALASSGLEKPKPNCSLNLSPTHLQAILQEFSHCDKIPSLCASNESSYGKIYRSEKIPGLILAPFLFPPVIQRELLTRLLHRDLSNPEHKTNLHSHYDITYPRIGGSFFSEPPSSLNFHSKDRNPHKNLNCKRALEKKLRWMTIGGQYDWTRKEYPQEKPPNFPADISKLIRGIFPDMEPQAAIVNLYSPGDTLSLHRDVSEEANRGLVSVSLGCDAYFIVGLHNKETGETRSEVLLLHSGDVLYMTGEARFSWHGVPWIVEDTCPTYLEDWPGEEYPLWTGWLKRKRVNLNFRQMYEGFPEQHPQNL